MNRLVCRGAMLVLVGAGALGCGGSNDAGGPAVGGMAGSAGGGPTGTVEVTTGAYEPLDVGVSWTYHVNDNGVTYDKISTVEASEDAGGVYTGVTVFRVHDQFPAETQTTWYQVDGLVVKRLHDNDFDSAGVLKTDDWYAPYRLRVDETPEHLAVDAAWTVNYTDTQTKPSQALTSSAQIDAWRVDGVDEPVTVPLGTFATLHLTRIDPSDGSTKSFWFARGIGKVKEATSAGHTEVLAVRTP